MLAELYEINGNTELAAKTFQKLLEIDPDNPDLVFKKAELQKKIGKHRAVFFSDEKCVFKFECKY
jgi:tetratricopeptide (TPR) repeat protein